jgi:hypothetical protein
VNSAKLSDWMQVVGIFALVASLIFVGLQMKQTQNIAIADQYQDRSDAALEYYLAQFQSDQMLTQRASEFAARAKAGGMSEQVAVAIENQGAVSVTLIYLRFRAIIIMFDNYHYQYEQGFLDESAWQGFRFRLKNTLSVDLYEALYNSETGTYRQTFQELCSQLLHELDNDLAPT